MSEVEADATAPRRGRPPTTVDGLSVPERLVETAVRLFSEKGFERTSVQDVVSAAGVTKGAMYHYFSSKDDLLHEIYARVLRLQQENLERFAALDAPVAERVRLAAADVVVTVIENLPDVVIFFRSLHQLGADRQAEVRRARRRYHETFRAMVADGLAAGEFRADVDPDLVVDYYFGAVHHISAWWRPDGALSAEELGREYADLLLASLLPR
ncbi:TetR/AcrR family transcriptional regulator [Nocardioides sp. YIM 152588]|uniref:TetR/AcrR family transcriptional regulator n=1 Tax=Nocardioides sp. YIM 152588 TaxID=3158259 RepID=UPI0032E484D0